MEAAKQVVSYCSLEAEGDLAVSCVCAEVAWVPVA